MNWHDPFRRIKVKKKWPLMPRQAMILHLYNVGLQTHEVAEMMQVSVHTLYKHLSRIFCKFNVHDRAAAIQKGISK